MRPYCAADIPAIQRIFPQWEIVQYLNSAIPWPYPEDGATSVHESLMASLQHDPDLVDLPAFRA